VIDDGSTDGTYELIKQSYSSSQISLEKQINNGVSSARNKGVKLANGDWIAFLDSDDEWFENKLELQVREIKKSKTFMICHTNEIWIRNGIRVNQMKKHQKYGGSIFEKCLDMCRISPSSVMIHRRIFDEIGLFDEDLIICEDYDLWLRISSKYPVLYLDSMLIKKFGGHADQLSKNINGIEQFRIQSLEKILKNLQLKHKQFNSARRMVLKKLNIYRSGLIKRNKVRENDIVEKKIHYWTLMVNSN
jgi:glycosyltransferase involved in cell wall biosynthesis